METDQDVIGRRVAERRCVLAMKALLDAAELAHEISVKEFASEAPLQLCEMLEQVARKATQRIPKLSADKAEQAVSQADLLCLLAREIAEHVRYAQRAVALETPWSMVETIAEFAGKVYGLPVSFILRPKWSYNYSLVGEFRSYYLDKLKTLFPQSDASGLIIAQQPIWAISFPRIEKSNTLLHACFGHELGHFVSAEWVEKELPKSDLLKTLKSRLVNHIKQDTQDPLKSALQLADLESEAQTVLKKALHELLADLASVLLFGPCAVFAMCHFATKGSLTDAPSKTNEYYPPWGYRLHQLLGAASIEVLSETASILEKGAFEGARTLVQDFMQEIRQFIGSKDACLDLKRWPAATRYAYEVVEDALADLAGWIRVRLAGLEYSGKPDDLASLCADLEEGIPPLLMQGGQEVATDFRDILNAGWLYLITRVEETKDSLTNDAAEYRTERRRLDLLVLKGIESSYLLQHHVPKESRSAP